MIGFNDLASTNEKLSSQWHPTKNNINPTEIGEWSNKDVYWKCPYCQKDFHRKIIHMSSLQNRCPHCSKILYR